MAVFGELQAKYPELEVWAHPAEYADLYDLTVSGQKCATSSWFAEYENLADLDQPGSRSIMLDNPENPTREVLLVTDKVVLEIFKDISEETARLNAEGDGSIADWKAIFGDFWKGHLPTVGLEFSEEGIVVTEFFHVEEV